MMPDILRELKPSGARTEFKRLELNETSLPTSSGPPGVGPRGVGLVQEQNLRDGLIARRDNVSYLFCVYFFCGVAWGRIL